MSILKTVDVGSIITIVFDGEPNNGIWSFTGNNITVQSNTNDLSRTLTGIKPGITNITYSIGPNILASYQVTTTLPLFYKNSYSFSSILNQSGGIWTSSDESILIVNNSSGTIPTITGISPGTTNLTYTNSSTGENKSFSITVSGNLPDLQGTTISDIFKETGKYFDGGTTPKFIRDVLPNYIYFNGNWNIFISSNDNSVSTTNIDPYGNVIPDGDYDIIFDTTKLSVGTKEFSYYLQNKNNTSLVTNSVTVSYNVIDRPYIGLDPSNNLKLIAYEYDGSNIDGSMNTSLNWESSNSKVTLFDDAFSPDAKVYISGPLNEVTNITFCSLTTGLKSNDYEYTILIPCLTIDLPTKINLGSSFPLSILNEFPSAINKSWYAYEPNLNPDTLSIDTVSNTISAIEIGKSMVQYRSSTGTALVEIEIIDGIVPIPLEKHVGDKLELSLQYSSNSSSTYGIPIGQWSSSNTYVATVNPDTGFVTCLAIGISTISYSLSNVRNPKSYDYNLSVVQGSSSILPTTSDINIILNLQNDVNNIIYINDYYTSSSVSLNNISVDTSSYNTVPQSNIISTSISENPSITINANSLPIGVYTFTFNVADEYGQSNSSNISFIMIKKEGNITTYPYTGLELSSTVLITDTLPNTTILSIKEETTASDIVEALTSEITDITIIERITTLINNIAPTILSTAKDISQNDLGKIKTKFLIGNVLNFTY